jgi:hypothetical protein
MLMRVKIERVGALQLVTGWWSVVTPGLEDPPNIRTTTPQYYFNNNNSIQFFILTC